MAAPHAVAWPGSRLAAAGVSSAERNPLVSSPFVSYCAFQAERVS